jgi:hypothetical protein
MSPEIRKVDFCRSHDRANSANTVTPNGLSRSSLVIRRCGVSDETPAVLSFFVVFFSLARQMQEKYLD